METNEENKANLENPMETTNQSSVANESAVELNTTPVSEAVTLETTSETETHIPVAEAPVSYFEESHEEVIISPELAAATDEEHADMQEEEHQPDFDVAELDKSQLLKLLEEAVDAEKIQSVGNKVRMIREAFIELSKAETEAKRAKFIEEGGEKDDFEMPKDALEDTFKKLTSRYNKRRTDLKVQREMSILENTTTKKHIIEEFKDLMKNEDNITKAYQKFQALQSKWRSVGQVAPSEANHLWQSYQFIVSQFFDVMKINKELRELDLKKNLELKAELCDQAEKLNGEKSLTKAISGVRNLQNKWKEIGFTGKEAPSEEVWQRFKGAIDHVFEKFKEHQEKLKVTQEENLKAKIELCNQLDEINGGTYATHTEWQHANDKVNNIWTEWQKISFVPKSDNNATWDRFKKARHKFNDLKEAFYNGAKEEQNKNMVLKTALCEKAEAMMNSTDWNATTNEYKRIQAEWKRIGLVPRKYSDKLWARFKKAGDTYFENKNNHFAQADASLMKNFDLKMEVIGKINTLEVNDDNRINLETLKKLQEEFRAIGDVPYSKFDTLAKEYRKAVDEYFGKIKGMNGTEEKAIHAMKYEQMQQSSQGKEEMMKERGQIQDKIKRLQAEVNQIENNLSFFGNSGKSNPMLAEYQQKIEKGKAEIKKLKDQLKLIPASN